MDPVPSLPTKDESTHKNYRGQCRDVQQEIVLPTTPSVFQHFRTEGAACLENLICCQTLICGALEPMEDCNHFGGRGYECNSILAA